MLARFQSASSILSRMITLPSVSSWLSTAMSAMATTMAGSMRNTGAATLGRASTGALRRASRPSSCPVSAATATPMAMPAISPSSRVRRPPHTDSAMMQPSVDAAMAALTGLMRHCASTPSEWRTAASTSPSPPMQMTVPTTAGGNSARMRVTSGPTARADAPYTSVAAAMAPGPCAATRAATSVIMNGLGICTSSAPLPVRPPQACKAVHKAMPSKVMATMDWVPCRSSPAICAVAST